MTKYLFLTTIFVINHTGKPEVSPDPQSRIKELEIQIAEERAEKKLLQCIIKEYEQAKTIDAMSKNHKGMASDLLHIEISNIQEEFARIKKLYKETFNEIENLYKKEIKILKKEIMSKCMALSKENKMLKAQLA